MATKQGGAGMWWAVLALGLFAGAAAGQERAVPGSWGALLPDSPVGFRVLHVADPTRAYGPMPAPLGDSWVDRPLQLGIWYPAAGDATGTSMMLGDLVDLLATELGEAYRTPTSLAEARRDLALGRVTPYVEGGAVADSLIERLHREPLWSRRGARPASGRFPVVFHAGVLYTQALLNEYLASHGYVVVGVPLMGSSPAWRGRGEPGPAMWEAIARDLAVARAEAERLEFADPEASAVIGMLAGSGLLWAMRDPRVGAVALLDAWLPPDLRAIHDWDPLRVRVPVLELRNTVPGRTDGAVLDSMSYASRTTVRIDSLEHPDFYPFARYVRSDSADALHPEHARIARHTREFLDDAFGARDADRARGAPPLSAEMLTWARYGRASYALDRLRSALEQNPDVRPVGASDLLTVARFLWRESSRSEAAEVARMVLMLDPENETALEFVRAAGSG